MTNTPALDRPPRVSAIDNLRNRLMFGYWAFTSLILALALFGLMLAGHTAQLHQGGWARLAYEAQLSQTARDLAELSAGLAAGRLEGEALDARLAALVAERAPFTRGAYLEVVDRQGTVIGRSESPVPAWAVAWTPLINYRAELRYSFSDRPSINASVVATDMLESVTGLQAANGRTVATLKARFWFFNMEAVFWLAGLVLWAALSGAILVLSILFGRWVAHPLARRLGAIAVTTQAWSTGQFDQRIGDTAGDEIGRLSQRLNGMAAQLQTLIERQQAAATNEERQRLARELHDSVKQQVFATSMQLGAARLALPVGADQARQLLSDAQSSIQTTHAELAAMIFALRPAALQNNGLSQAIGALIDSWRSRVAVRLTFDPAGDFSVPAQVENALFRVTQEALFNLVRHSQAQQAIIRVTQTGGQVAVSIHDDGVGFDPTQIARGVGLHSMQRRMSDVGGDVWVDSTVGAGTTVTAVWPAEPTPEAP